MTLAQLERLFLSDPTNREKYLAACASAIASRDGDLNAFISFDRERAETNLREVSGGGPLAGVPVAVKDNIVTTCAPTTCGSRILPRFAAPREATVIGRLRRAGAYVLGKTNLDEFAMGSSTEHSAFGVTRNPWDRRRVAGGSSGGSAAAVAAGMAPVALGSETGGSVRQPAAFCGVSGLKPTYGRVSRSGLVAFASSLDQVGVIGATADDCERLFRVIAGHDPADSTSADLPVAPLTNDTGVDGLRMAVVKEATRKLSGELRENFESSVGFLRSEGATIEEISLPSLEYAIAVYYIVANAEASANLARFDGVRFGHRSDDAPNVRELYTRSRGEGFGDEVKRRIMLGTFALSSGYYEAYYGRAQGVRSLMRREVIAAFERFDVLLTPTTPGPAFRVGEKTDDPLAMYLSDIFTAPANLTGIPALAVPSGLTRERLPLSLQLMAKPFDEALLFRVARAFERSAGWLEVKAARDNLA